ncbi:MAG: DUF2799 domain-containing protein [Gammaproteobacteria bacterium]|nr:DUF2799 domain-containing protein [Gammaproteobacteria bacterium]
MKHIFILTSITLITSACSTMNKNECLNADWRTIGYGDGARGYKASRISEHRSACAEYGVRPDLNAYNGGREEGLGKYCTPTTGYNKGLSGYRYNGVCAGHNERDFVAALNYGLTIYKEVSTLNNLKSQYQKEVKYIQSLENELRLKEDQIVSGRLSKVKAVILLNETKEIAEELGKAKSNLNNLDYDINNQTRRVADMKNQGGYR